MVETFQGTTIDTAANFLTMNNHTSQALNKVSISFRKDGLQVRLTSNLFGVVLVLKSIIYYISKN